MTASPNEVEEHFGVTDVEAFPPRYNIAPTQPILIIAGDVPRAPGDNRSPRRALLARWGLLPAWVKDPSTFPLLFNARSDTVAEKSSFRAALRHRRVLVPASGFYEWHRPPKETRQRPVPYWIRPRNGGLVAFAGLMETYMSPDGAEMDTAAIVTCAANASISSIHERMPVVIMPEDFERWLDCRAHEPRDVADLMTPAPDDYFEAIRVSDLVNKVANAGPELQEPAPDEPQAPAGPKPKKREPGSDDGQMSLL